MSKKIWVKCFKVKDRFYCYDVVSNNIMKIDQVLYYILKKYNYSNRSEVIEAFGRNFPTEKVLKVIETIDNFKKEKGVFALRKRIRLHFPFSKSQYNLASKNLLNHMILNLTEQCNFRCQYCKFSGIYPNARKHNSKSMAWRTIKSAVDFLVRNASYILNDTERNLVLGFYGGEPCGESKKIMRAIRYLKNEYKDIYPRFRFSMTTNGSLLNEKIIKELVDNNCTLLISLDGPGHIHNRYRVFRNGKGTYETIIDKLELIKQISPEYFEKKVGFSTVIAPEFHFKEVVDYFRNYYGGKNRVYLFSLVDSSETDFFKAFDMTREWKRFKKDENVLRREYKITKINNKFDALLTPLFDVDISDIHRRGLHPIADELYPNGICLPGLTKMFVDTDGNIHFCEKINWKFNIGNIFDGFGNEKIFHYIEEYIRSTNNCKYCWAVRFCKECFLSSLKDDRFSREEKKLNCRYRRKRILKNMKDYVSIKEENPEAFNDQEEKNDSISQEVFRFLKARKASQKEFQSF